MKIVSYNVNGIRSALNKGLIDWMKKIDADVVCFQEVKANLDQINSEIFKDLGYEIIWNSAIKKGYSGTAILTRVKPSSFEIGCHEKMYDDEGRIIRVDFTGFSILNVYIPSGSSGESRQSFKMQFLGDFYNFIKNLYKKKHHLLICGDFNICHKPIDIHNPKSNANTSGFLPEEREWISHFFSMGFIDTFRKFNSEPHNYTWWSYMHQSRNNNLGWRIDYHVASIELENKVSRSVILKDARHSDHCPVFIEIL